MDEKELVIKYLNGISKLEKYYSKRHKKIDDYIAVWRNLEKGDEIEQLRFIFNNEPKKMIKYIGVIDFINDVLISKAINDKEHNSDMKILFIKDYIEMFTGYSRIDYLKDKDLSKNIKELAEIYFDLKEIEKELYLWLKQTQNKVRYIDTSIKGLYI